MILKKLSRFVIKRETCVSSVKGYCAKNKIEEMNFKCNKNEKLIKT